MSPGKFGTSAAGLLAEMIFMAQSFARPGLSSESGPNKKPRQRAACFFPMDLRAWDSPSGAASRKRNETSYRSATQLHAFEAPRPGSGATALFLGI